MALSIDPGLWVLTTTDDDSVVLDLNFTHRAVLDVTAAMPFIEALVNDDATVPVKVLTLKTIYVPCYGCESCDQEGWFTEECDRPELVVDTEIPVREAVLDLSEESTRRMFVDDVLDYHGFNWMTFPGADGQ